MSAYRCCRWGVDAPERSIAYHRDMVYLVLLSEPGRTYAVPKYRAGPGPLHAKPLASSLSRLVYHYRPGEVRRALEMVIAEREPCLGGPLSPLPSDSLVCSPSCRREELLLAPRDALEVDAASLIAEAEALGARVHPTGSLLAYHHDPRISDIDLVAYMDEAPCHEAIDALETLLGHPPRAVLEEWARRRGVTPSTSRRWLQGWWRGRRVSTSYAYRLRQPCELAILGAGGPARLRLRLEPGGCRALAWPHVGFARDTLIVSFDGIYAPILYEGGVVEVQGLRVKAVYRGEEWDAVLIGVAEAETWLRPTL